MSEGTSETHPVKSEAEDEEEQHHSNGDADEYSAGGEDANLNNGLKSSLAEGLSSLISTVIKDFDSQAHATIRSQDQLSFAIDRLTGELDKLLEDAPSPFITQHAARITDVRKRVSSLNSALKSIQRRLDNVDRMLCARLPSG